MGKEAVKFVRSSITPARPLVFPLGIRVAFMGVSPFGI
jgi:hypothetical protein